MASFRVVRAGSLAEARPAYLAFRIQVLQDGSKGGAACRGKDSRESGRNEEDQEACIHLVDRTFLGAERA